jgi:hypothetical protein
VQRKFLLILSLVFIGFVAFLLRFDSVKNTYVINSLRSDARDYFMYAYNLRYHHVYSLKSSAIETASSSIAPDAIRSPGYPLFLWFFMNKIPAEKTLETITFAQLLLSTLTIGLVFLFFRFFLPAPWALVASLLAALSPHLIVMNSYVLSETLFCFSIISFAWMVGFSRLRPSLWIWGIAGMMLGFASLVRPGIQYFPLVMIFLFVGEYGWKSGLKYFGVLVLGFVLIFSPWIIRNEQTLGVASDKTLMINFLHHGMYPNFIYNNKPESFGFPYRYDPLSSEISKSVGTVLKEIERRFIEEPGRHLKWFLFGKPVTFWSWNIIQGVGDAFVYPVSGSPYFNVWYFKWSHWLMKILNGPLTILAMTASLLVWFPHSSLKFPKEKLFVARFSSLLLLYFTFLHMVGAPFPRYSIPLRPFIYGMGLFLLYLTYCLIKKRFGTAVFDLQKT